MEEEQASCLVAKHVVEFPQVLASLYKKGVFAWVGRIGIASWLVDVLDGPGSIPSKEDKTERYKSHFNISIKRLWPTNISCTIEFHNAIEMFTRF